MFKRFTHVVSILALLLCASLTGFAQETAGAIEGTISDPQGNVVPGVSVTVTSRGSTEGARPDATIGFNRTVTTDDNGFFRVLEVPPGFYNVTTTAVSGFSATAVEGVEVVLGKTTPVTVRLQAGGVQEVVTVTADSVAIDPTDNKIQTNITAQTAELLPKGTNFTSLLQVAPAVRNEPRAGGFQVDGASGSENSFIIDGQEVTNFRTGQLNTNNNLPFQLVQEVQIKSSGFEAEFGGATGGVINVVTKGGSNEWHGEFGVQFQPAGLQSGFRTAPGEAVSDRQLLRNYFVDGQERTEYFTPRKDEGTHFFPTGNLSGPIVKDRVWFFMSYTPQVYNNERTMDFVTANPANRSIIATRTYHQRQINHYAFTRLDANLTNNLRVAGTFTWNPIERNGVVPTAAEAFSAPPDVTFYGNRGGRANSNNVTGKIDWTPTSNLVVSGRLGRSFLNEKINAYGVPSAVGLTRFLCSSLSGQPPAEAGCVPGQQTIPALSGLLRDVSVRRTVDADASYLVNNFGGRHHFKFGYQYNGLSNDVSEVTVDQVVLQYGRTIAAVSGRNIASSPDAIGAGFLRRFNRGGNVSSANHAIYFQDSWQPTQRLTLNLGLRMERESVPSFNPEAPGIQFNWGDKLAPRLGFAYDLTGDGRTKLFGSFGRFYDRFKYELPRGSFGGEFFRDDYFEIFPGMGAFNSASFNPAAIIGNTSDPVGGQCPVVGGTGLSRCQLDRRIPSNFPGANLELLGGVDPDIKPFRQSEFTVGFERDLGSGFLTSGRYTHKQVDRTIEDIGFLNAQGGEAYIIGNPGEGLARRVFEANNFIALEPVREYDAFEIRLDKRFTRSYYFNASYTLSRLYGNYSGTSSSDEILAGGLGRSAPNVQRYFDLPFAGFTAEGRPDNGRLPTDRPHAFKLYGAYSLGWDRFGFNNHTTELSGFTTVQSGTPVTTRFDLFGLDNIVLSRRGDLGRTEAFTQTDFALRHKFRFGANERMAFVFDLDILNLFNEANELGRYELISPVVFSLSGEDIGISDDTAEAIRFYQRQATLQQIQAFINDPEVGGVEARYNLPNSFQTGRTVRFGFRFLF